MKLLTEDLAKILKCSHRLLYTILSGWRFDKYIVCSRPRVYEINSEFIEDLSCFFKQSRRQTTKNIAKNIPRLKKLLTP